MKIKVLLTACLLALAPVAAIASPVGTFDVVGTNGSSGVDYTGTVSIERTGDTYVVYWKIGADEFVGTGLGAKFVGDRFEVAPASDGDTAISVGYISKDNFGVAMFFLQPDGTWHGAWTFGGSKSVAYEKWAAQ